MGIWEVSSSNFFANNIELSDWVKIHLTVLKRKFWIWIVDWRNVKLKHGDEASVHKGVVH